jgi:hypothetical protein
MLKSLQKGLENRNSNYKKSLHKLFFLKIKEKAFEKFA